MTTHTATGATAPASGGREDAGPLATGSRGHPAIAAPLEHLVLALVAFVPVLAAAPGVVSSDTKTYLYLDPSRFLSQVTSMWYPTVALGTVTHQYIGYLFPMGPYYALAAALHVPAWVAQRLWLGAILFAAGAGVLFLCKTLSMRGPGRLVGGLAFMLSPYILQYTGRISVILLPWAGLPWLVGLTVVALRRGGWRAPAQFALVVALVSGINATAVLYVAVAPVLWLAWAVAVEREATWRRAGAVLVKIGLLSLLASAWWIAGLVVEAGYGVDILRYTESVEATSSSSTSAEVLRGLGYWYFYGSGRLGPWTQSVVLYTKWLWLVALSYFVPLLAFCAGVLVRWRHRGYFVALVVVGVVLSVGAYPYASPTAVGGILKSFMSDTTAGLAMRSTDRATPLALLGLAMLLAAFVSALWRRSTRAGWATGLVVAGLVVANNPAVFNGDAEIVRGLTEPASLPRYELAALHSLNATEKGTRVLAVPGDDFAAYTWGDTTDTPQPAVLTRPFVTREQQVMGSMATADTLYALDAPIQTSVENWSALAPMARLLGAGNVMVEYDQESALYGVPQARTLARSLATEPKGLADERAFGSPGQRVAKPTLDPEVLSGTPASPPPSPVVTYRVTNPRPLVRAESDTGALVVAGDATGLEELAAQGLLNTKSAIYYAGTLDTRRSELRALLRQGATLVVTDTNRKQGFRWNSLAANAGQIEEAAGSPATATPNDAPIDLFPEAPSGARTVATFVGAADITASSYGNSVSYDPEDRPYSAVDGNLRTAWVTGTFVSDVDGQWWQAALGHRVAVGHVTVVQPQYGTRKRTITRITLTFTGRHPVTVALGRDSRRATGQRISFPRRTFRTLRITIDATSGRGGTPVGFAEVEVPGQRVVEVDQMPTDLLSAAGAASLHDRLVIAMTRQRVSPYTTARTDPQTTLSRSFTLPTARTFTVLGTATLSPYLSDPQIDRLVGVAGSTGSGVVASSSSRLTGDLAGGAGAAAGSAGTPWQSGFGAKDIVGAWLRYDLPAPVTFGHMTLTLLADRRHSLPQAVRITATTPGTGTAVARSLALPRVLRSVVAGTTVTFRLRFPPVTGRQIRVTFTEVAKRRGTLASGDRTEYLPLGVSSVGIPGVRVPPPPSMLPATCRPNLLAIDGHPVTVEVVGPTALALGDGQVTVEGCGKDAAGVHLAPGHHVVESTLATTAAGNGPGCAAGGGCDGWNLDQLTLDSAPGGGAEPLRLGTASRTPAGTRALSEPTPGPAPAVRSTRASATTDRVAVGHAAGPFELVLGESVDAGWHAVAHPGAGAPAGAHPVTLGAPELVDAFANGWQVTAKDLRALGGAGFTVTLTWTPQRLAWAGIAVSAAAVALCLLVAFVPCRRWFPRRVAPRRDRRPRSVADDEPPTVVWPVGGAARRLPWWGVAVVAVATGALAGAISSPLCGAAVAVAVAAGLAVRHLRVLGAAAAVGLLAAAGAIVVAGQVLHPAPGGGDWPASYNDAAVLAAMAVAFFGADAVVDYCRMSAGRAIG
jgi:arabinofuranan 3-O-arabinosyltransferase